jgi:2-polyprenyl-3-methyl-5-hydroxy-6-metoxy-1,4-benzoquinol methylase
MKEMLDILSKDFNEELKLIDIGSGPVTSFFQKLDIYAWNIITVDPLAELYNDLNETYKVNYPIKCIEGTGEHLDELFEPNSFHLVLSQNSIDHSESPIAYINCLYYLCKPGGFIYISGHIKVGSSEHWVGI